MDLQLYTIEQLSEEILRRSEFGCVCVMMSEQDDRPYYYSNFKGDLRQVESSLDEVGDCLNNFDF